MQCKHEPCNNEAKGNGSYCSKSCRAQQSRRNRKGATELTANQATAQGNSCQFSTKGSAGPAVTLEHYEANPDMYATRANPHRLNWGPRMNMNELNTAGKAANRVPIPGDHDYKGVAK